MGSCSRHLPSALPRGHGVLEKILKLVDLDFTSFHNFTRDVTEQTCLSLNILSIKYYWNAVLSWSKWNSVRPSLPEWLALPTEPHFIHQSVEFEAKVKCEEAGREDPTWSKRETPQLSHISEQAWSMFSRPTQQGRGCKHLRLAWAPPCGVGDDDEEVSSISFFSGSSPRTVCPSYCCYCCLAN